LLKERRISALKQQQFHCIVWNWMCLCRADKWVTFCD